MELPGAVLCDDAEACRSESRPSSREGETRGKSLWAGLRRASLGGNSQDGSLSRGVDRRSSMWGLQGLQGSLETGDEEEDSEDAAIDQLRRFFLKKWPSPKAAFKALDLNGNGQISLSELTSSMSHYQMSLSEMIGNHSLTKIFRALDIDGGGELSHYELFETSVADRLERRSQRRGRFRPVNKVMQSLDFIKRVNSSSGKDGKVSAADADKDPVERLRAFLIKRFGSDKAAFLALDKDGNRQLSLDELTDAFKRYNLDIVQAVGSSSLETVFNMMDIDLRGEISFNELFHTTAAMRKDLVLNFRRILIHHFGSPNEAMQALTARAASSTDITLSEMRAAFIRLNFVVPPCAGGPDLKTVFSLLDVNGDGSLSSFELFRTTLAMREDNVVKLRQAMVRRWKTPEAAFRAIDTNGDGKLSFDELKGALHRLNAEGSNDVINEADLAQIFEKMDIDGVGKLSFFEMFQTSCGMRESKAYKAVAKKQKEKEKEKDKDKDKNKSKAEEPSKIDIEQDEKLQSEVKEFKVDEEDMMRFPRIRAFSEDLTAKELNLKHNHIGERGAQVLSVALSTPGGKRSIKLLQLEGNYIGSHGVQVIAPALESNCKLQRLILSWNGIADGGAIRISSLIRKMTSLNVVDLAHNRIGNMGAHRLAKAVKATPKNGLKTLDLIDNPIGASAVKELRKACGERTTVHVGDSVVAWSCDISAPPRHHQVWPMPENRGLPGLEALSPLSSAGSVTSPFFYSSQEDSDGWSPPSRSLSTSRISRSSSVGRPLSSHADLPADGWAPLAKLATALQDASHAGQGTLRQRRRARGRHLPEIASPAMTRASSAGAVSA
eukprot:TRINITY_DN22456_c0_g1_i2.p1 TRINITY_DN22456_c0_g1~~TRINITY_DN22456_c0_g1_i2.p1  ORF type:complete len:835 (+),score=181.99 TRINITY_DN22456_c0_g1_i2:253-2757(+)